MMRHRCFTLILFAALLLALSGCAVFSPAPTLEGPVELTTPTPPPTRQPSPTPRSIASPTVRPTSTITPTPLPTRDPSAPTATPYNAPPPEAADPDWLTQWAPGSNDLPLPVTFGVSVEDRPLGLWRSGDHGESILLVGGIHGGWEANTVALMNALIDHFEEAPETIAPGLNIVIVPVLNPDGYALGRDLAGRFNAVGVDLNRNWACDWSADAVWAARVVNAGQMPFSEPESSALADYVLLNQPFRAAVIYHSPLGGVFPGDCDGNGRSAVYAALYANTAGYPLRPAADHDDDTGRMVDWFDSQGIAAFDVELSDWTNMDLAPSIEGITALQCAILEGKADATSQVWAAQYCTAIE